MSENQENSDFYNLDFSEVYFRLEEVERKCLNLNEYLEKLTHLQSEAAKERRILTKNLKKLAAFVGLFSIAFGLEILSLFPAQLTFWGIDATQAANDLHLAAITLWGWAGTIYAGKIGVRISNFLNRGE